MKPLNRPMFRMGGPIKEGIMDGIEEPRIGFQDGTPPGFFGISFDQPFLTGQSFKNLFKTPAQAKAEELQAKQAELSSIFTPDFSMSDYGKVPKLVNQEDTLLASAAPDNIKISEKKMEMVDPNIITTADITEDATPDGFNIKDETKTEIVPKQAGLEIPDRKRGKILTDPDKKPKDPEADSELLQKLGYDRAVKRGNYQLIEAIRRGLTEGGVQGALDAAFAAGAQDPYREASKIRQAAALKEFESDLEEKKYQRRRGDILKDKKELTEFTAKINKKYKNTTGQSIEEKRFNFGKSIGLDGNDLDIFTRGAKTIDENILTALSKSTYGTLNNQSLFTAVAAAIGADKVINIDKDPRYKTKADVPDNFGVGNYVVEGTTLFVVTEDADGNRGLRFQANYGQ
jgi:hypothetical protein